MWPVPRLPDQIRQAILAHAYHCAPDECCGLLAMDPEGAIRFAYPLTNVHPSPVSYTIDPDEHIHALNHAEALGWEIGGVFHSHPGGTAAPSMVAREVAAQVDATKRQLAQQGLRLAQVGTTEAELARRLEALVLELPPDSRAAILLRHQQDLPYEEIARVLGVPLGTVKARIHRARIMLREKLLAQGDIPWEGETGEESEEG